MITTPQKLPWLRCCAWLAAICIFTPDRSLAQTTNPSSDPTVYHVPADKGRVVISKTGIKGVTDPYRAFGRINLFLDDQDLRAADSPAAAATATYYLPPLLQVDLDQSFKDRARVAGTTELEGMTLAVQLCSDAVRRRAAEALTAKFKAPVAARNIQTVPYEFIQIQFTPKGGNRITVATYPQLLGGRTISPANWPDKVAFTVTGTKSLLDDVAANPTSLSMTYWISGFHVKQDTISNTLATLVALGYHNLLTGKGDWNVLGDFEQHDKTGGVGITIFNYGETERKAKFGFTNKTWVTRNQVRAVAEASARATVTRIFSEGATSSDVLQKLIDSTQQRLMKDAEIIEAAVVKQGDRWALQDERIDASANDDEIKNVNAMMNGTSQLEAHDQFNYGGGADAGDAKGSGGVAGKAKGGGDGKEAKDKKETGEGNASAGDKPNAAGKTGGEKDGDAKKEGGGTSKGIGGKKDWSYTDASDVKWELQGTVYVPKSVHMVRVHNSVFQDAASADAMFTVAERAGELQQVPTAVAYRRDKRERTVTEPRKESYTENGWVEIFRDHFNGGTFHVVNKVDFQNSELTGGGNANKTYLRWCTPLDRYKQAHPDISIEEDSRKWTELARDEHIKKNPDDLKLPPINKRWPQIMDDERWYAAPTKTRKTRDVTTEKKISVDGEAWTGPGGQSGFDPLDAQGSPAGAGGSRFR